MLSIDEQIERKVQRSKAGSILFSEDFQDIGTAGAVHVALHRLVKTKKIRRLARGIYVKPKYSELVGELLPDAKIIATAIARRDKAKLLPTGSYAQYLLGLSTQIPLNLVYLTDGSPRKIKVGNRVIQFKKTTPKNLSLKGKISKLVVQALKEMGKTNLTTPVQEKIQDLLKKEKPQDLKHDIKLAPQWIAELMANAL